MLKAGTERTGKDGRERPGGNQLMVYGALDTALFARLGPVAMAFRVVVAVRVIGPVYLLLAVVESFHRWCSTWWHRESY